MADPAKSCRLCRLMPVSWLLGCLLFLAAATPLYAAEQVAREVTVKAVYIYNFIRFTEWPNIPQQNGDKAFLSSEPPGSPESQGWCYICAREETTLSVVGNLELLKILKSDSFRQTAKEPKLTAHGCSTSSCMKRSHALFIDQSESRQIRSILQSLGRRPILTISDAPGFAEMGGMIEIDKQNGQIRLKINLEAIKRADLYVSAQLLQLAEIVGGQP